MVIQRKKLGRKKGNRYVEGCAFAIFAFDGDGAVVGFHHTCYIGESDAYSAHVVQIARVHSVESFEDAF